MWIDPSKINISALTFIGLGVFVLVSCGWGFWRGFQHQVFYGKGGIKFTESPAKSPFHFWSLILLLLGCCIGGICLVAVGLFTLFD
jgi:hypothetical protein